MCTPFLRSSVLLIIGSLLSFSAIAGDSTASKKYPAAVLVMLNTETNRIAALEKANRKDKAAIAKQDGEGERKAMINDFTDHLDFCPVYYFMDTNLEAIKAGQLTGHLRSKEGTVLTEVPAILNGGEYFIVFYGIPLKQYMKREVDEKDGKGYNDDLDFGKGLVICNSKMVQGSFLYMFDYGKAFARGKAQGKYRYASETFDIEYYPFVKVFNKQLKRYNQKRLSVE